jgi:hypothetical protein
MIQRGGAIGVAMFVLAACAASGCGGVSTLSVDGGAGTTGGAGSGGTTGGAGSGGTTGGAGATGTAGSGGAVGGGGGSGRDPMCPASVPVQGASCNVSVTCEYRGADTTHECSTMASCNGSKWYLSPPAAGCGTHPSPCPATYATLAEGAACPTGLAGSCDYDEGRCACLPCFTSAGAQNGMLWTCRKWDSGGAGCPPLAPLAGTACGTPDQFCYYSGFCGIGVGSNYKCTDGYWRSQFGPVGSCALRMCGAPTQ